MKTVQDDTEIVFTKKTDDSRNNLFDALANELGNIASRIEEVNRTLREANAIARCLVDITRQTQRDIDALQ